MIFFLWKKYGGGEMNEKNEQMNKKMEKKKKNWTPTSGCACAHPREPLTSHPVKGPHYGGYCAISGCACAEHTSGHVTSLPVKWSSFL